MNRRIVLSIGVVVGVSAAVVFAVLSFKSGDTGAVSVLYLKTESGYAPFPSMAESERFDFDFRNGSSRGGSVELVAVQSGDGRWIPMVQNLGEVEAGKVTRVYLYLPKGSHPPGVRLRFLKQASRAQGAWVAARMAVDRITGRYPGRMVWLPRLKMPAGEFTVGLVKGDGGKGGEDRQNH